MHYSPVAIHNSTKHRCDGKICYSGGREEPFAALAWDTWTSQTDRGLLLVTRIEAKVTLDDGLRVDAYDYKSAGSGHSQFAVIRQKSDFVVTRIVYHHDDVDVGTF
jgi:hypothetical protein